MSLYTVFGLLVLVAFVSPVVQAGWVHARRARALRSLGRERGARVVPFVHHVETIAFCGVPVVRYISVPLGCELLRDLTTIPRDTPVDLLVHLPPGLITDAEVVARVLAARSGRVTLVVPEQACSGGLLLALAADEVLMGEEARIGAVDLKLEGGAAGEVLRARRSEQAAMLLARMRARTWRHDEPLAPAELRECGVKVRTALGQEWTRCLARFPQPEAGRTGPVLLRLPSSVRRPRPPES